MRRLQNRVQGRWVLWSALLVACGSRSQLLGGSDSLEGGANAGATSLPTGGAGIVMPSFGGATFVTGGAFVMGGNTTTGGVMTTGGFGGVGPGSAGISGMAGVAGTPVAGQGGEGGAEAEPGEVLWGKRFGDEQPEQHVNAIAVEPNGTFSITGGLYGKADFGGGPEGDQTDLDLFLAQYNADGSFRWAKLWSNSGIQQGQALAIATDGLISVAGGFSGSLDMGGELLQSGGNLDAFMLSFDHDGEYRHGVRFGDNDTQGATGVAITADGQQAWAGYFRSKLTFEGSVVTSSGSIDAVVAGFDREGAHLWNVEGGNVLAQRANAIAYAPADDTFFVTGEMFGILKWGSCSQLVSQGENDGWLAWLDSGGNCLRSLRFGDSSTQAARAVAVGKAPLSNLVAVVGDFSGNIDVAGGSSAVDTDAFVLLLSVDRSLQTLTPQWIRRIGGSSAQSATAVAFDAQDNLIVAGSHTGDVNDPPLKPLGDKPTNAFVVKYDSAGTVQWAKSFGDDEVQSATAVGTDDAGNVYVAGSFHGSIPLATGTLISAGADDAFVLKLAP